MAEHSYDNLKVSLRPSEDGSRHLLGVEIDGGFLPFFQLSEARIAKTIQRGAATKAEKKTASK